MTEVKPTEAAKPARRRGRPPKDASKGLRRTYSCRLHDNTREKLLDSAVANNRSLSEEIEFMVERGVEAQEREAGLDPKVQSALTTLEKAVAQLRAR
jgi:hypothetical protein